MSTDAAILYERLAERDRAIEAALGAAEEELLAALGQAVVIPDADFLVALLQRHVEAVRTAITEVVDAITEGVTQS